MLRLLMAVFILALAGCQTAQPLATASGRPEVSISAPASQVHAALVGAAMNRGYTIRQDSQYLLVVEKPSQNFMANVLLGSQFNPVVNARMSIAIAEIGGATRVVVDMAIIQNPGSGFERALPANNSKDAPVIQAWLDEIAASFAAAAPAKKEVKS